MAIILDGSLGIQRDEEQQIANIEWFLYGLPDTEAAPEDVVFLNESFGTDSPQMVSFTLEGEEYAVYADWQSVADRANAVSVRQFYKEYGYILLSGLLESNSLSDKPKKKEWLVPAQYFDDYVTMVNKLSHPA